MPVENKPREKAMIKMSSAWKKNFSKISIIFASKLNKFRESNLFYCSFESFSRKIHFQRKSNRNEQDRRMISRIF